MQIHRPCLSRFSLWPRNLHIRNPFDEFDAWDM